MASFAWSVDMDPVWTMTPPRPTAFMALAAACALNFLRPPGDYRPRAPEVINEYVFADPRRQMREARPKPRLIDR